MMFRKTEVISLRQFLTNESKEQSMECSSSARIILPVAIVSITLLLTTDPVHAATATEGVISRKFDEKIWPLMLDIGRPLAKTMMAIGIYKCIRNDVDKGWKTFYRAGLGLIGLFLIDGVIHIIDGVGTDLSKN